jgi:aquaporin Z
MDKRKLLAEFIGTFMFMLIAAMVIKSGKAIGFESIAIGAIFMTMIYAGSTISGAHYNPAISLAAFVRGIMTVNEMVAYMATQIVAAVFAAFTSGAILQGIASENLNLPIEKIDVAPAILAEFFGTFALVYVTLNVATSKRTQGNSYFGLAIGFTLMAVMYAFSPVSGAMFNPALMAGSCVANIIEPINAWVYLVGEILGAVLAAIAFRFLEREEVRNEEN